MKKALAAVAVSLLLMACTVEPRRGKVLMILDEPSLDPGLALDREVGVMRALLGRAGFEIVTAAASKGQRGHGSERLGAEVALGEVIVSDYRAIIIPSMDGGDDQFPSEACAIVRRAVGEGRPVAAQNSAVLLLARAGVLNGKRYAFPGDLLMVFRQIVPLDQAIYSGEGVVQDGNIITSGISPLYAKETCGLVSRGLDAIGVPVLSDGTMELTHRLIAELRK